MGSCWFPLGSPPLISMTPASGQPLQARALVASYRASPTWLAELGEVSQLGLAFSALAGPMLAPSHHWHRTTRLWARAELGPPGRASNLQQVSVRIHRPAAAGLRHLAPAPAAGHSSCNKPSALRPAPRLTRPAPATRIYTTNPIL